MYRGHERHWYLAGLAWVATDLLDFPHKSRKQMSTGFEGGVLLDGGAICLGSKLVRWGEVKAEIRHNLSSVMRGRRKLTAYYEKAVTGFCNE